MMVITTKLDEVIHLGDDIQVKVLSQRGRRVCVAFEAPRNLKIESAAQRAAKSSRKPSACKPSDR